MTTQELYQEILKQNTETENNFWEAPQFLQVDKEHRSDYFNIKLKSFKEVVSSRNVDIYRVCQKYENEVIIYCRRAII